PRHEGLATEKKAEKVVFRMKLIGGNRSARVLGQHRLTGAASYIRGRDPRHWRLNVPAYAEVRCENIYPGVDLIYYGNQRQLEYDFVVAPGADPTRIAIGFDGADQATLNEKGDLILHTAAGDLVQQAPFIYQQIGPLKSVVAGRYILEPAAAGDSSHKVHLEIGLYDQTRPLVIDPVLVYSTYLGGSDSDLPGGIAADEAGNVYVAGSTVSADFPLASPLQPARGGGFDAFVAKLSSDGSTLLYATYLGGEAGDFASAIAVDTGGQVVITGVTASRTFPIAGGLQPQHGGGPFDGFVAQLTTDGSSLIFSTYLGGSGDDRGQAVAIDAGGHVLVIGLTESTDFPTMNPLQAVSGGGYDVFVSKIASNGLAFRYSTYFGGSRSDFGEGIAVARDGRAFLTGFTSSLDFPTADALRSRHAGGVWDA
ncbi:MAG: SBBP repeat-containing protein, partial [Acidimicrobiia bacterium]